MKKILLGAVSIAALGAISAQAADLPPPAAAYVAPPAAPAPAQDPIDWSGGYIGLNAGVAFLQDDVSVTSALTIATLSTDNSDTGFTFGGQLGWNFQFDNLLLGVEGDLNYLDVDSGLSFTTGKGAGSLEADYDWFATVRARAGFIAGNNLFYATGGIAFLGADFDMAASGVGTTSGTHKKTLTGWTIGAGVEHMFNPNWTAKAEYLYANFGSHSFDLSGSTPATSFRVNPDLHIVRVGLNYLF